ncbi:hypothetical protein ACFC08_28785 [Streptomyces sp. NPDC056112]|uniref:hypothetical protein n=1 Tax=Streptomyces sp. NPDC056112 TaxID=3345715 RepID=UPI0035DD1A36
MENRIGLGTTSHPDSTRAIAEQIAGLLAQSCYKNDALGEQPLLIVRLVNARTGEHLANAFVDAKTAENVRDDLHARVNGRPRLHLVGGGR